MIPKSALENSHTLISTLLLVQAFLVSSRIQIRSDVFTLSTRQNLSRSADKAPKIFRTKTRKAKTRFEGQQRSLKLVKIMWLFIIAVITRLVGQCGQFHILESIRAHKSRQSVKRSSALSFELNADTQTPKINAKENSELNERSLDEKIFLLHSRVGEISMAKSFSKYDCVGGIITHVLTSYFHRPSRSGHSNPKIHHEDESILSSQPTEAETM